MRFLILLFLSALAWPALADEGQRTPYTAVVTGIVCQSCKATVVAAIKKLPGVGEIEFAKGDQEGSHKLFFTAASGTLTKIDAENALGEHVKEFSILSLEKTK